jgi:hypothetical protein
MPATTAVKKARLNAFAAALGEHYGTLLEKLDAAPDAAAMDQACDAFMTTMKGKLPPWLEEFKKKPKNGKADDEEEDDEDVEKAGRKISASRMEKSRAAQTDGRHHVRTRR